MNYQDFMKLSEDEREKIIITHSNQQEIRQARKSIESARKLLEQREIINQNSCEHPAAIKVPRADTGNYDPGCDAFWFDCVCPDCGKTWREDQ